MKRSDNLRSTSPSSFESHSIPSGKVADLMGSNYRTLTKVRTGLTASPQMSLADFKVVKTEYGLEVHFSQRRIKEDLTEPVAKLKNANADGSEPLIPEPLAISILTIFSTIVFVGGAVVITGSVLIALMIATILPAIFWLITGPKEPKQYGQAILRVSSVPHGRTLLTLKTAPAIKKGRRSQHGDKFRTQLIAVKNTVHCASLPVHLIKPSSPLPFATGSSQMNFVFESGRKFKGNKQLTIAGTQQEIQWLYNHLAQQNDLPLSK